MKKTLRSVVLLLILSMLLGIFASCAEISNEESSATEEQSTSEIGSTATEEQSTSEIGSTATETDSSKIEESSTESESYTESDSTVSSSDEEISSETEPATEESTSEVISSSEETTTEATESTEKETMITGEYAGLIENANELKNGIQANFSDSRDYFSITNSEMNFTYALDSSKDQLITSLTNKNGAAYITNTMDVFVRMKDGSTYYASGSTSDATANLYRIGMYYYEARFEEQNFFNDPEFIVGSPIEDWSVNTSKSNNIKVNDDGIITITKNSDPYAVLDNVTFATSDYNVLKFKIRAVSGTKGTGTIFIIAGGAGGFSSEQSLAFSFPNDGEYHDILIPLYNISNYKSDLTGIRFDIDGSTGDSFEIAELTPSKLDISPKSPTNLRLCRSFYVYSNKMHHNVQIAALETTKNIAEVGMSTTIDAETVSKIFIKDANGPHTSLDGVDWTTVEYVGFDIIGAGIFGYILPVHENAGTIRVSLVDGQYLIEQTRVPERNGIEPSEKGTLNANDFHISQRIYTDDTHTFDEFIREAEIERNPITKSIRVSAGENTQTDFIGYDPIRGIYVVNADLPGGFNSPYYLEQNKHYAIKFTMKSPDTRDIYVMTVGTAGSLECSVILNKNNVLLPIPVAVCKNFSEAAGERNLFNLDDDDYSEAFIPLSLQADVRYEFQMVNIYQNWGQYPLKQISSIQFRAPYYHLSTGVTESNCILPWYETKKVGHLNTLPDFRAMSAPLWEGQPQRNSGGAHTWLEYTDADGNYSATENYANYIDSYGPTYADVTMYNLSYDGKIKATYTHMEMPQTDENRTYYEIKYEVLQDISIKDFKNDFTFYAVTDNEPAATADYRQIGYLNENNECTIVKSNLQKDTVKEYVLGTECPYFSMFNMPADASPDGYTNVACLIYNYDFVIGGNESDANFIIINSYNKIDLSLDLGEVTLKAGDSFTINAILMPWGSHESDYSNGDVNVREVRENTLLNPVKITSETDEIIESVFVPKVRSTDGETATFTIKDGHNNIAIRAYGFKKLTAPTLYELVDGNWEKVELSSCNTPDTSGYYNYYDGYMVHYDGDGTYSYSFVTAMENGMERTFKLDLSNDVESFPDSGKKEAENLLDIYYDPTEINNLINASGIYKPKFSQTILSADASYVSLYANNVSESFFMIKPEADEISGKYIVVKYRIPTTNSKKFSNFEFYLSTSSSQPTSGENIKYSNLKQDGQWHVVLIDASTFNLPTFSPDSNGIYNIKYIRFDVLNTPNLSADNYIDIGFFGMCDSIEEVCELTKNDFERIDFVTGTGENEMLTETGALDIKVYIDPESGYTESTLEYFSVVDKVSGVSLNAASNSVEGIVVKKDFTSTVSSSVSISGWAIAEGGIDHYVWSVDGGLTWNTVSFTPSDISETYINHAQNKLSTAKGSTFTFNDKTSSAVGGNFQSQPMTLDLSAHAGETVDFILAMVPKNDTNTLCLMLCIENLTITQ